MSVVFTLQFFLSILFVIAVMLFLLFPNRKLKIGRFFANYRQGA